MRRFLVLASMVASLALSGAAMSAAAPIADVKQQGSVEAQRLILDRERLAFDQDLGNRRLAVDKEKYEQDHRLEQQKYFWSIASIAGAVIAWAAAYYFQIRTRRKEEALQFELKAAEIVMNARDTNEAKNKADLLTMLFPGRLNGLQLLRKKEFPYFGRSVERREDLLKLLGQYPNSRADIIRAWEIFFPWDSEATGWSKKTDGEKGRYKWFDELKKDAAVNQNRPSSSAPSVSC